MIIPVIPDNPISRLQFHAATLWNLSARPIPSRGIEWWTGGTAIYSIVVSVRHHVLALRSCSPASIVNVIISVAKVMIFWNHQIPIWFERSLNVESRRNSARFKSWCFLHGPKIDELVKFGLEIVHLALLQIAYQRSFTIANSCVLTESPTTVSYVPTQPCLVIMVWILDVALLSEFRPFLHGLNFGYRFTIRTPDISTRFEFRTFLNSLDSGHC